MHLQQRQISSLKMLREGHPLLSTQNTEASFPHSTEPGMCSRPQTHVAPRYLYAGGWAAYPQCADFPLALQLCFFPFLSQCFFAHESFAGQ